MIPSARSPAAMRSSPIAPALRCRAPPRRLPRTSCACASTTEPSRRPPSPRRRTTDEHRNTPQRRARARERRPELRDRRRACGGDRPPARLRRGRAARDARAGARGPRAGRVLRRRARGGQPGPRGACPRRPRRPPGGARRRPPMSTYDLLTGLTLSVDGWRLEGLRADVSSGFERLSTVVHLRGGGAEGIGEDVVYSADDQRAFQAAGEAEQLPDLSGEWPLGDFCDHADMLDLFFGAEPEHGEVSRLYRRWTMHSAALDLALRQAGRSLHGVLGREPAPLTFVVSLRLGEPATPAPVQSRLALYPTLRFKLDATSSWTEELIDVLARTGAVDSVDFKAHYRGTVVDTTPDGALYRRVVAGFPEAWLEDPDVESEETAAALANVHDRITWDAPIHGIADIEALPFPPRMVNLKPSRLGGLERLCAAYDYCAEHGIGAYGGGQFELGPGRGQAQYLASLFHPDTPNDLAPVGYNEAEPRPGLPASPLAPAPTPPGFQWGSG